jgi:deoxyadenosine/deoxycytidine kinase
MKGERKTEASNSEEPLAQDVFRSSLWEVSLVGRRWSFLFGPLLFSPGTGLVFFPLPFLLRAGGANFFPLPGSPSLLFVSSAMSKPAMATRPTIGQVVLIEGNISAGKSTIAAKLGEELGYKTFFEPTGTNPYLESFYADPQKFALRMQIWLLKQRYNMYLAAVRHTVETGQGVILDRSVFSDWVFAAKNLADGNIDAKGYQYYERLREQMLEHLPLPHTVLYLDVSAEECHRRIRDVRKRSCESTIPLDYLQGLDECYQEWIRNMEANGTTVAYSVAWEDFGDHVPIMERIRELHTTQSVHERTLELIYSKEEIRKAQVLDHDLWSEDEHEHSLLDDLDDANNAEKLMLGHESMSTNSSSSSTGTSLTASSPETSDEDRGADSLRDSVNIQPVLLDGVY